MKNVLISIILFSATHVFGQISGTVKDADGTPLPGATILEKGTQNGVLSDVDGNFRLTMGNIDNPVVIRFVGHKEGEFLAVDGQIQAVLQSNYRLEDLIIQGVRALDEDPVSQTTLSKKEVTKKYIGQHPLFIIDKLSPSIYSYSESGAAFANYGQIRLRGIGQERINFTLNGVPLNDMIDHGVFFSNFTDITSNFESIQVQRGIGTSSNGTSSYAGSINFETVNLKKVEAPFSKLEVGLGSFGTYRANYSLSTGVNDKGFGFYSSFSRLFSDGFKRNTETDAYSFFVTGGYYGERNLVRLTAFTGRSQNGLGYYTIDESILEEDRQFNNLTDDDNDDFSQYMVQLQHSYEMNKSLVLSNTLYYGGSGGDFAEGTPDIDSVFVENYLTPYELAFFQINFPLKNDHFGLMSNLLFENNGLSLSTGVHLYAFKRENREEILPQRSNPYYQEESKKNELALFSKLRYDFGDFRIFADAQLRHFGLTITPDYDFIGIPDEGALNEKTWTFFNPTVGFTYFISSGLSTYASYGISHREPTKVDLFGGFQLNASNIDLVRGDPEFMPERVNDLEIGMKWSNTTLALDGNFFFMDFKNEIAPIGEVIAFGVQRRENIPSSFRSGLELNWFASLSDQWRFKGNASYIRSEIDEVNVAGETLSNKRHVLSPEWILNGGLEYTPAEDLLLALEGRYVSEQFMELSNSPDFTVPQWMTFDWSVSYSLSPSVRISGSVNNIFDRKYYAYGLPSDVDFSGNVERGFFVAPERNYFLTAVFEF